MLYSLAVINWFSVFINLFWVVGLAVLLAAFSYHAWLAGEEERPLKLQLNQTAFQKYFWLSVALIAIGLAGTSQRTWEILIWTIFTLISIYNLFTLFKTR
ncbi:MAG: hypothetical protein R6X34_22480 [Chloroflexota bacterium]|jgi:hypothetical protein